MKTFAHDPFVKIAHKSIAYILVFCVVNMPVWALDWNQGTNANFTNGDTVNVTALRSVIEWNNFDTAPGQLLQFLAGGGALTADHAVLNKVINGNITQFDGILQGGQGHILLINPAGIMIGSTATINAGRFTASTMHLQMSDTDFLAGASNFEFAKDSDDPAAQISLLAGSSVTAERVDLLAQQINNAGTITTETGGIVVMAAGDRVLLGEAGSDVIVEMTGIENGMVTNDGTIKSAEGTIVMAAGDIFSTSLGMKVFNGAGKIVQNGTLDVNAENATAVTGNGGTIEMLAGEDVTLAAGSVTTANAIPDDATNRYDGGDIIIESTETVNISLGAFLYAKGNGWDDVDENFRFDFGVDTSFSGSIQIFAKNLNLPASDVFASQIDLFGYNEGPLQQLQSGFLTIGNNEGDMIVAEGPLPGTSADNTIYEEWIEGLSLLGIHIDTLSAGDITFNDLNPGDAKDLGLIGGAGNMAFRTQFDSGGIIVSDLTDIIGTLDGGDVFMVAGSGGITVGEIDIENEDRTGDPGQIILATANGGDISTYSLIVESGNREIVSISSSGDVLIDGGVHVATNEVPDSIDKTATAEICIDAGDDITINGPIEADAHGKVEMITSIHIDAGLDAESNDDGESQAGIINIDLGNNGQIVAVAEESGPDPDGTNDLYSEATIEIHTSAVDTQDEDAINIIGGASGGNQAVRVRAKVQGESPVGDSMPGDDPTSYSDERIGSDGDILKSQIVLVEIESGVDYDQPDYSDCDNCVKPPFLPPTPEFFLVKNDAATVDWRAGYTIIGDGSYDPADLDVLLNDNGPGVPLYDSAIIIDSLVTEKGGTLEWVEFQYTDGDGVTHIYDGFVYTPPSYTEDFEWDGVSDYATFTDSFQYQGYKQESDSLSLNTATVTLTVQNEVPTLAGDSDTIHMNTSSDFDLSTLATDNDGTPGELTGEFTGTYGDLSYDIVEGLIPVADGTIPTDSSLIPDTLTISGDMITYAPLDGYVSPTGEPTTFGYTVSDDNIKGATFELPEGEYLDVTVTNTLPGGDVTLSDAPMNASGETVTKTGGNDFTDADSDPFAIVSIDPATDDYNKTYGGTLSYNGNEDPYVSGNTYDYTADAALPGYVGEDDFDATLWDGQTTYYADGSSAVLSTDYGQGTIDLDVVNDRPEGDSWLGTTSMDTALTDVELATDGFSDINGDTFSIEIDGVSSDDYNGDFGGSLNYDGSDYDYDPTAMDLPGYTGDDIDDFDDGGYVIPDNADDRFDVKLWDGEYAYTFDDQGGFERTAQYGEGSISVDITNELPESDAWFGQVHMDSQGVTQGLEVDFAPSITVDADTYTGSVIGSDNYGGTLEFDGTTWTYSTDTTLPGYVGDDNDDFGQGAYVADDLFSVNLSNGQYDYWFSEEPAPDGYEYYAPEDIYRKAVFSDGTGTVSVDITNVLPTIDENTTIEHMNEDILNQLFAADQLDPNPNDGLDSLSVLGSTISDFGIPVTVTQNPDGSLSYTYDPADGFVNEDSFDITVWDGQRDYVFNDNGEIVSDNPVTVDGAVSLEYTNITPTGTGDLGTTESGTTLTVAQSGTTSPVIVIDIPDLPQQDIDDVLSIPAGAYTGSAGGTLVYNGTDWIYTPAPGFSGTETFKIDVWDGQNAYGSHIEGGIQGPVYGQGTVTVTVSELPPPPPTPVLELAPVAPLADYEIPRLVGCPAEMEAAANELATNSDQLQLLIANAMATNPNLQPCDACASLLTAATVLKQMDNRHIAALAQIFNSQAPIDAPFTPEVSASVATAFANFREMETELAIMTAEQYEQYQQYALADELVEAFVSYVAVLENDLKLPVGDAMALVMDKYGEAIEAIGNPNISVYLIEQMEAGDVASELIVASAD